jgi:non-canonical purine NTP pyrophosphatase (RdgB/HAM1 family)
MSKKQNIVFVTGNKNKLSEASSILGDKFEVININVDLQEIQSTNVKEVIEEKIKEAEKIFQEKDTISIIKNEFEKKGVTITDFNDFTVICEDTGLHINSLNIGGKAETEPTKMFPGALIKFYLQALGPEGIISMSKQSPARLSCYIGVIKNGKIIEPVEAIVEGKIANAFIDGGFGFDPCFVPNLDSKKYKEHQEKSYGQLPIEIKNEISHRAIAFMKLKELLEDNSSETDDSDSRAAGGGAGASTSLKKMNGGGLNFQEKYLKYKEKYIQLKTEYQKLNY